MSCIKACFDERDPLYGFDDCKSCQWADNGSKPRVYSVDTSAECVEKTQESIHVAPRLRRAGSFGD